MTNEQSCPECDEPMTEAGGSVLPDGTARNHYQCPECGEQLAVEVEVG